MAAAREDQKVGLDFAKGDRLESGVKSGLAGQRALPFDEALEADGEVAEGVQFHLERVHARRGKGERPTRHGITASLLADRRADGLGVVPFELIKAELDRAYAFCFSCIVALGAYQVVNCAQNDKRTNKVLIFQVKRMFALLLQSHLLVRIHGHASLYFLNEHASYHICILGVTVLRADRHRQRQLEIGDPLFPRLR